MRFRRSVGYRFQVYHRNGDDSNHSLSNLQPIIDRFNVFKSSARFYTAVNIQTNCGSIFFGADLAAESLSVPVATLRHSLAGKGGGRSKYFFRHSTDQEIKQFYDSVSDVTANVANTIISEAASALTGAENVTLLIEDLRRQIPIRTNWIQSLKKFQDTDEAQIEILHDRLQKEHRSNQEQYVIEAPTPMDIRVGESLQKIWFLIQLTDKELIDRWPSLIIQNQTVAIWHPFNG